MSQEEFVERRFVYTGRRWSGSARTGKVYYALAPISEVNGKLESPGYYSKNPGSSVGSIFRIPASGTALRFSEGRWDGKWEDRKQVQLWEVQDLDAGALAANKSLATKAKRESSLDEILEPLQELSLRLTPPERRALAARILEVLR